MASRSIRTAESAADTRLQPQVDEPDGLSVRSWRDVLTPALLEEWRTLDRNAAEPNPFFSHWYLPPAFEHIDPAGAVLLATIRKESRLIAVMPVARQAIYYGYPIPSLRNWMHANAFCGTPLVALGHERTFWRELLAWADENPHGALFAHITHLPQDGPLYAALRDVAGEQQRAASIVQQEERAMLRAGPTPAEHFNASVSAKKRKELRRQFARLSEQGAVSVERLDDDTGLAAWIDEFLTLEAKGWKGAEGSALASDPITSALFEQGLQGAAEAGVLERLTLRLDGRAIAMLANFQTPPGSFAFKTTFDEDFARYSPGVLLQRENLELVARDDIAWCDSCAAADHPMIERIWRDRRTIVSVNIAIGGNFRRALFAPILRHESGQSQLKLP